jgi:enoyl-CoA hydratase
MGYHEIDALRSLVGAGPALEILLEGCVLDAEEVQRLGIVLRIVADDDVMTEARNAAERIAAGAPLVHRWHRKLLRRLQNPTPLSAEELAECYACFDTEDFQTGYRAFLEKKTPEFKGR